MFKITLFISLFVFFLHNQSNSETDNLKKIIVFGVAEKEVTPDKMEWSLFINNTSKQLQTVAEEHNKIIKQVIGFLKSCKIDETVIQTSDMQFGENWQYNNGLRVKEGYFASTNIHFSITDFKIYKDLWVGLSKIEHVNISLTRFDHTKKIEIQNEVRKKALLKAQEKAKAMANTLSLTIGDPIEIEEDQSGNNSPYLKNLAYSGNEFASLSSNDENLLAPGQLKIAMKVKVIFELLKGVQ